MNGSVLLFSSTNEPSRLSFADSASDAFSSNWTRPPQRLRSCQWPPPAATFSRSPCCLSRNADARYASTSSMIVSECETATFRRMRVQSAFELEAAFRPETRARGSCT